MNEMTYEMGIEFLNEIELGANSTVSPWQCRQTVEVNGLKVFLQ